MAYRAVLVDYDEDALTSVSNMLKAQGFRVAAFHNGEVALQEVRGVDIDLLLIDIKMSEVGGGRNLVEYLWERNNLRVIYLVADDGKSGIMDGLYLPVYASDRIMKPVSPSILVKSVRRLFPEMSQNPREPASSVKRGELTFDPARKLCLWNGKPVNLSLSKLRYILERLSLTNPSFGRYNPNLPDAHLSLLQNSAALDLPRADQLVDLASILNQIFEDDMSNDTTTSEDEDSANPIESKDPIIRAFAAHLLEQYDNGDRKIATAERTRLFLERLRRKDVEYEQLKEKVQRQFDKLNLT
jgi:two-component system response regulator ChvI